jgi:hypothetical protein
MKQGGNKIGVLWTYANFCGAVLIIFIAQMYLNVEEFVK